MVEDSSPKTAEAELFMPSESKDPPWNLKIVVGQLEDAIAPARDLHSLLVSHKRNCSSERACGQSKVTRSQLQSREKLSVQTGIVPPPPKHCHPLCQLHTCACLSTPSSGSCPEQRSRPFSAPALALSPGAASLLPPSSSAAIGKAQGTLGTQVKVA